MEQITCELCGRVEDYESAMANDTMVLGANAMPELLDVLEMGNWDYACIECYQDALDTHYGKVDN